MAVLFVAQAHGLNLDLGHQLIAAASCLMAVVTVAVAWRPRPAGARAAAG